MIRGAIYSSSMQTVHVMYEMDRVKIANLGAERQCWWNALILFFQ